MLTFRIHVLQEFLSSYGRILFRRGDTWQGMLHLKGSGNAGAPILLSNYGDGPLPLIDGNGYQACILLYNEGFVEIDGFELTNEASHLDEQGLPKKLDSFLGETNDYGSGKSVRGYQRHIEKRKPVGVLYDE